MIILQSPPLLLNNCASNFLSIKIILTNSILKYFLNQHPPSAPALCTHTTQADWLQNCCTTTSSQARRILGWNSTPSTVIVEEFFTVFTADYWHDPRFSTFLSLYQSCNYDSFHQNHDHLKQLELARFFLTVAFLGFFFKTTFFVENT